jgi:hypothetical protein
MSSPRPIAEWRARWESNSPPVGHRPREPRPPRVYLLAAFAGTALALCRCLVHAVGWLAAIGAHNGAYDRTPHSLTYVNDTDESLWIYECVDRCASYDFVFPLDAGDEESERLTWHYDGPIDWIVLIHANATYGCIEIPEWKDQTIRLSREQPCPQDIHSPEANRA